MKLKLVQIENQHSFNLLIEPNLIELDDEFVFLTNSLKLSGKLTKQLIQIDVEGSIKGSIKLVCSRCLENADTKIENDFIVAYVTDEFFSNEVEVELKEEDLEVSLFDGETIDLIELAREQLLLEVPTHYVCNSDCQGLCPKCGINLNNQTCNCETKEIDPRWAKLKELS